MAGHRLTISYPLWWALGIADFMGHSRRADDRQNDRIAYAARAEEGSARVRLWLLFLVVVVAGIATITLTAPGTVPSLVSRRVLSYGNRTVGYFGDTVLLLYAGNLTESELPRRTFSWMLGVVGVYTVIGGVAGMLMPHFGFASPLFLLLPKSFQANAFVQAAAHPALTQVQNVLGTPGGRPKAPFDYTNLWGECLTILLPFLLAWAWTGTRRQRLLAAAVAVIAMGPLLYSLNRGVWIGVILAVVYLAVRLAARGKTALLGGIGLAAVLAVVVIFFTPLNSIVAGRLENGKSNNLRSHLNTLAITDAIASPIIGYGDTRQEQGSPESIAVGPSAKCPVCGQLAVGSTGQICCSSSATALSAPRSILPFSASESGSSGGTAVHTATLACSCCCCRSGTCSLTTRPARRWVSPCWPTRSCGRTTSCAGSQFPPSQQHLSARRNRSGDRPAARPGRPGTRRRVPSPDHAAARDRHREYEPPAPPEYEEPPAAEYEEPPATAAEQSAAGLAGVARGGVINLAGAVVSAASSVALTVIVTRNFSKSVVGTFFVAISLFLIVEAVTNLGAYNGTIYFIARVRALNAERRIPAIIRATLVPVVISSVIGAAALIAFVYPLAKLLLAGQVNEPVRLADLATMLRVLAVALPCAALADTMLGATRGFHEMRPTLRRLGSKLDLQLVGVRAAAGMSRPCCPLWPLLRSSGY
jgi:hypothetical protein